MKRRSITLGKEQVAELMVRLDKIPGLVESLIDSTIIPSREDVHMATTDRRDQKLRLQAVVLDKKRRRIAELEDELGTFCLPDRKRMRTENSLSAARTQLHASEARRVVILSKASSAAKSRKKPTPTQSPSPSPSPSPTVTRDQWLQCHREVASCLFHAPKDAQKHWNGIITTDGVSCSWHQIKYIATHHKKKTTGTKPRKRTEEAETIALAALGPVAANKRPRDYGTHSDGVWIEPGPLTIIAVDPGHVTLVDAVRHHPGGVHVEPLPDHAGQHQRRRHRLRQKLGSNSRTHFSLSNVHWISCLWTAGSCEPDAASHAEDGPAARYR
jgi:hypothetical protein